MFPSRALCSTPSCVFTTLPRCCLPEPFIIYPSSSSCTQDQGGQIQSCPCYRRIEAFPSCAWSRHHSTVSSPTGRKLHVTAASGARWVKPQLHFSWNPPPPHPNSLRRTSHILEDEEEALRQRTLFCACVRAYVWLRARSPSPGRRSPP